MGERLARLECRSKSRDPSNEIAPVKIQVIDATPTKRAKGRMIWCNLTTNTVNGKVGTQEIALAPNTEVTLNLSFRIPDKEHDYPLCETQWSHDGRSNMFVVVMDSGRRTPRVIAFPDQRQ